MKRIEEKMIEYDENNYDENGNPLKKCPVCGKKFSRPDKRGAGSIKYCSELCRRVAITEQVKKSQKKKRMSMEGTNA